MRSAMRDPLELGHELGEPGRWQRAAQLRHPQPEQVHRRHLGDERLRRGDGDLQPGAREEHAVGVAGHLRAHDVRDRQDGRAALAGEPHGGEGVSGLA
jgi:hypothetical protein